jgi:3-hydroxyacyl-[acyl-carrier-protein] dehydratase
MISSTLENKIINSLPYGKNFLFVDGIKDVNENEIVGTYTFKKDNSFYQGHFPDRPVTPGVLLVESMGQIGLVCFGIYLLKIQESHQPFLPFLSHIEVDFHEPVYPGETVTVHSEKIYFRNNILKCKIKMLNSENKTVVTKTGICTFKLISE